MPATFGERCSAVVLATTTRSMVAASTPPLARACSAACSAMSGTDSSGPARRRVTIPVRVRIHSSLVSTIVGQLVVGDDPGRLEVADGDRLRPARSVPRDHRGTVVRGRRPGCVRSAAMTAETYDLVIIGGGIGGSALATVMQRAGRSCLVLERTTEFPDRTKGEWIAPWGVAEAQRLGVLDDLATARGPLHPPPRLVRPGAGSRRGPRHAHRAGAPARDRRPDDAAPPRRLPGAVRRRDEGRGRHPPRRRGRHDLARAAADASRGATRPARTRRRRG